jgi:hypothetical protein
MSMSIRNIATLGLALLVMMSMVVYAVSPALSAPAPQATNYPSEQGITPQSFNGNFKAADDDQICYEIAKKAGYTEQLSQEVRGFKIDPPVNFANQYVDFKVSADLKELSWTSTGAEVLGVVVKGGDNYNLYDYKSTPQKEMQDAKLHSPLKNGKIPQISHYNVCYMPDVAVGQGCTPGFWRNDTPANRPAWNYLSTLTPPLTPTSQFLDSGSEYNAALTATGGGYNALLRHASAAYLDASMGSYVGYPYTTGEVQAIWDTAISTGDYEPAKDKLQTANELGCPLSATNPPPTNP